MSTAIRDLTWRASTRCWQSAAPSRPHPSCWVPVEATGGLASLVRQGSGTGLPLTHDGLSILVKDKNVYALLCLSDRHHILEKRKDRLAPRSSYGGNP